MLLDDFIKRRYGDSRGCYQRFLIDNPHIIPAELSRWKKKNYKINLETGEVYTPTKIIKIQQIC